MAMGISGKLLRNTLILVKIFHIMKKYLSANKALWNARTQVHLQSQDYDVTGFKQGKTSLNATELGLLGDVKGKKICHLQCHFGLDSLSLAKMGANVVGVDFAEEAIQTAKALNDELKLDAEFICCNIYDLPKHITQPFDIVFTSYGVLCWLPDLKTWAEILSQCLKPGGKFCMVEFHPALMMLDFDDAKLKYSYFNHQHPIVEEQATIYTDIPANQETLGIEYTWNHALDEVISELLSAKLRSTHFKEYPYSHYGCFPNMSQDDDKLWYFTPYKDILPLMFSIYAEKER
jgi:2-polyprenyl-3-methyl-5-hydroxy-6-metoxy-1,4-benzoquinol methylase